MRSFHSLFVRRTFDLLAVIVFHVAGSSAIAQTGACCSAGVCTQSTAAACLGTFQGNGSCIPDPCAVLGVCCRGTTCTAAGISAIACTHPSGSAGARFTTAAACNAPGNDTSPCCYADYNKVNGISVQDIFDFLGDWFAGSPYANFGGDGSAQALTVQDIFSFLSIWFAGGCS